MKFSRNANSALKIAREYAGKYSSKNVGTEHLLIGLIECKDATLADTFKKLDVETSQIADIVNSILHIDQINKSTSGSKKLEFTPRVVKIIEFAKGIAQKLNKHNVEVIHLFLSLLYENDGVATSILVEYGLHFDSVKAILQKEFGDKTISDKIEPRAIPEELAGYFNNITSEVQDQGYTPWFVRDVDYSTIFLTLAKKHNANIIMTGEPGVGKCGVVYELARRISKGHAPASLCGKTMLEIKIKSLISGTKYRGDFESRMDLIHTFIANSPDVILYISDISMITRIDGTSNVEEYFGELFALDNVHFIGCCDTDNFKKHIDDIKNIVSKFEIVSIKPTSRDETLDIIKSTVSMYEKYHSVRYKKDVYEHAISLSDRYFTDTAQPTAAINLLDECGAFMKIKSHDNMEEITKLERMIDVYECDKIRHVRNHELDSALGVKEKQDDLRRYINGLEKPKKKTTRKFVSVSTLKDVVYRKTGIPVDELSDALPDINEVQVNLRRSFVSQSEATDALVRHFKRVKVGLQDPGRPLASFMFLGPTGVGKTYLCELISQEFFHSKKGLLKIDMSEYMDKHSVSKLIGSPPGYVGYGDRCILGDFVKENPYCLILLDEVEKAHPEVMNIFLQVLDKGDLTDSSGRKVNFKNTIIVFTSNIGVEVIEQKTIGFGGGSVTASTMEMENALKQYFKPEFLNRLDEIVQFKHLDEKDIFILVDIMNKKFVEKIKSVHNISFVMTPEARDFISNNGYSKKYGARFLRRFFEKHIECEVATLLINQQEKPKKITCKVVSDNIVIE